jgi:hypothetical protein
MKLSRLFMIALLAGTLGVIGCGDDATNPAGSGGSGGSGGSAGTGGTAGSGGSGTAGTGGGGVMCDETAQEICDARCDVADQIPECVSFFDDCLVTDPSVNPCEKCASFALEKCGGF